jgi:predicted NAD/FAD-binding protein
VRHRRKDDPAVTTPIQPRTVAVIGTGIAGLSAAWLLSQTHDVTVYEAEDRIGGHSHTVEVPGPDGQPMAVDMGFIVYNEEAYPNLSALFRHFGVATEPTCMSLGISLDDGALEYGSRGIAGFLAQPSNLLRPRFLRMVRELVRFYTDGRRDLGDASIAGLSLGDYLNAKGYSEAFQTDHLLPQAAAIWSSPVAKTRDYPAEAFIRFFDNHGLMKLFDRQIWRTTSGRSRDYVQKLTASFAGRIRTGRAVSGVRRTADGVRVRDASGEVRAFDQVVIAAHSNQALAMLDDPSPRETALLGAIRYGPNRAVLHRDASLMPRRKAAWSSWNYVGRRDTMDEAAPPTVSYWMNQLQNLPGPPLFVSLNPTREPEPETVLLQRQFDHPLFDGAALQAQRQLWSLQGVRNTWFCGAYFGAGFHEDGLQSGLAAAEAMGGARRPWTVRDESGRISLVPFAPAAPLVEAA